MLMFFVAPFCVVIYYSFIAGALDHSFVGLKNYINVWNNGAFQIAVKNTAVFSGLSVPLAVVLALVLALMLECRIPFKSQFRTFFLSPMMVPVASIILVWQVLFHSNGVINEFLSVFGVTSDRLAQIGLLHGGHRAAVSLEEPRLQHDFIYGGAQQHSQGAVWRLRRSRVRRRSISSSTSSCAILSPTVLFVTILSIINSFKVFREIYLTHPATIPMRDFTCCSIS